MAMRMLLFGVCLLGLVAGSARAEPFYLRYDADVFPEEAGWERHSTDPHGEVIRTIEDGVLTIDSSASLLTTDWYLREIPELELSAGEELRLEWRMRTLMTQTSGFKSDVSMGLTNGYSRYAKFYLAPDFVSVHEDDADETILIHELAPMEWNTYVLHTGDMQQYQLQVNGDLAICGTFCHQTPAGPHLMAFGDTMYGRSSIAEWDYVKVEVVPEPQALALVLAVGMLTILWRMMS